MMYGRIVKLIISALALALFALSGQVGPIQASDAALASANLAEDTPHLTYLPIVANNKTVSGRLTSNGAAVAGQKIVLRYTTNNWASYSEYGSTTSDASGNFWLVMPPLTSSQHQYQLYWKSDPNKDNGWLGSFSSNYGTMQTSNHHYEINIADVRLISPNPGAVTGLPVTFLWNRRTTTNDNYSVILTDAGETHKATLPKLGYVDRATITSLPSWAAINTRYYWYVMVETPAGVGTSYWMNAIYFRSLSSLSLNSAEQVEWVPADQLPAGLVPDLPTSQPAE